ncbi:MAG: hypothetical protein LUM44_20720 [Pyrinomonadaceae bacterium]|nr:hypothetical protein [Pyrinomonadaceae bacterium]
MAIRPAEAALAVADPTRAAIGYNCAKIAEHLANTLFDDGRTHSPDDTEQNAFKHAYWNALMVKHLALWAYTEQYVNGGGRIGEFFDNLLGGSEAERWERAIQYGVWWAKAFGDAHENDPPFVTISGNTAARHAMDYRNNEIGRNIAVNALRSDRETLDRTLAHNVMRYLADNNTYPASQRMIIEKPEYDMSVIRNRI